jgi:hypothetical protein
MKFQAFVDFPEQLVDPKALQHKSTFKRGLALRLLARKVLVGRLLQRGDLAVRVDGGCDLADLDGGLQNRRAPAV